MSSRESPVLVNLGSAVELVVANTYVPTAAVALLTVTSDKLPIVPKPVPPAITSKIPPVISGVDTVHDP